MAAKCWKNPANAGAAKLAHMENPPVDPALDAAKKAKQEKEKRRDRSKKKGRL